MRRHGWGGDIPSDDDEARGRILRAARDLIRADPSAAPSISQVAERLSVTRQTVYRYFPSTHALLVASVSEGIDAFLDDIADHLADVTDAPDAVVEGIAYTYEQLHERPDLALLILSGRGPTTEITAPTALALGRSILDRLSVDWVASGYAEDDLGGLVELMLRTLQSFVVDPGSPPRTGEQLRDYLTRWIGPAVAAAPAATR